jgi:hypothetical protein
MLLEFVSTLVSISSTIKGELDLVDGIVKASVCLHNYLLLIDTAKYVPMGFADSYSISSEVVHGEWRKEPAGGMRPLRAQGFNKFTSNAKQTRDRFFNFVNSETGVVPWQLGHVRNTGRVE